MIFNCIDLTGKRDDILKNREILLEHGLLKRTDDAYIYIEDFVNLEKRHDLAFLESEKNDELLGKWSDQSKVQEWMRTYRSTTFIATRTCWLYEYCGAMFVGYGAKPDWTIYKIATTSYMETLGQRHGWFL